MKLSDFEQFTPARPDTGQLGTDEESKHDLAEFTEQPDDDPSSEPDCDVPRRRDLADLYSKVISLLPPDFDNTRWLTKMLGFDNRGRNRYHCEGG